MRAIVCLAAIGICAVSCAAPEPGWSYSVVFDPSLPSKYVVDTTQAIYAWQDALDFRLQISWSGTGICTGSEREICIHAATHAEIMAKGGAAGNIGFTIFYPWSDRADMYLPVVQDQNDPEPLILQIASHEFGHCLHAQHETAGHLMCWETSCATEKITCGDVAQVLTIHGAIDAWGEWHTKACPNGGTYELSGK